MQWCRDNLGLIRSIAEIETLALTVDGQRRLLHRAGVLGAVRAVLGRPRRAGILVGLTSYVTKAHIGRAVLEATAWQIREVVDAMNADAGVPLQGLSVDGGMTTNNLLMQMMADVLDIPVVRPMIAETVSLGAAYAAGVGAGYWSDHRALRRQWRRAAEWQPHMDPVQRDAELARWRRAVELSIAWGA